MTHFELVNTPQLGLGSMSPLVEFLCSLTHITILHSYLDALQLALCKFGTRWPQMESITLSNNQLDAQCHLSNDTGHVSQSPIPVPGVQHG